VLENQLLIQSLAGLRGVTIGVGGGFATSLETGAVTVDPSFFVEQDYRPEWCTYGLVHELVAHLREMVTEPDLTKQKKDFYGMGQEYAVFANVFDDIAGNKRMHQVLPTMADVAKDVYKAKLTPDADMTEDPRHTQFLFGLLRESMVEEGDTILSQEVQDAIDGLRAYGANKEDAIAYVSNPNIHPAKRWRILQKVIWPVYEALLDKDMQDNEANQQDSSSQENEQSQSSSGGEQKNDGEAQSNGSSDGGEGQAQGPESGEQSQGGGDQADGAQGNQSGETDGSATNENGQGGGKKPHHGHSHGSGRRTKAGDMFGEAYEDYWKTHPEILNEEQSQEVKDLIDKLVKEGRAEIEQTPEDAGRDSSEKSDNKNNGPSSNSKEGAEAQDSVIRALEAMTGFSYETIQEYRTTLERLWPIVDDLERFFDEIIGERLTAAYKQRRYLDEGVLNGDMLAGAVAGIRSGGEVGAIYSDISEEILLAPDSGGFDFYLLVDRSTSMSGQKMKLAAEATMAIVEGLASCHQKVLAAQNAFGVELGLDVATNVMLFGDNVEVLKPTGEQLSEEERMTIFTRTKQVEGGTGDYLALEKVLKEIEDGEEGSFAKDRKKVIIVVTDGQSGNVQRARTTVDKLRQHAQTVVMGIGIGADDATRLYSPDGQRVDRIDVLADVLVQIVKSQIASGVLSARPR
jgi:uncharacterized protein YegL